MKLTISLCALALFASSTASLAIEPEQKCQASKLMSAGKYDFCRLKAESAAAKTGGAADYSKCDAALSLKWSKAETTAGTGVCPSEGDESALKAFMTQHTDDVAAALAGGSLPDCPGDLAACSSDLAAATACGNGSVEGSEDCDFGDLAGDSCVTLGFAGGMLACGSGCAFDTSSCYAARFVDNGDGTITDNETSLMWEKKAAMDDSINLANLHDADNTYPWSGTCSVNTSKYCQPVAAASTACTANAEGGATGCEECSGGDGTCSATETVWTQAVALNAASFAGHTDWRVPTRAELQGILDYGDDFIAVPAPFWTASCFLDECTDLDDPNCSCPLIVNGSWSASAVAPSLEDAWALSEGVGEMAFVVRTFLLQVRAVRGGS